MGKEFWMWPALHKGYSEEELIGYLKTAVVVMGTLRGEGSRLVIDMPEGGKVILIKQDRAGTVVSVEIEGIDEGVTYDSVSSAVIRAREGRV